MTSPAAGPSTKTKLITPGGNPASSRISIINAAEYIWLLAGFQTTVFPNKAGVPGRFPAMAVKLNGVNAKTNPSNGLYSNLFHTPGLELGC